MKTIIMILVMTLVAYADPNGLCRTKIYRGGYSLIDSKGNRFQIKCVEYPIGTTLNVGTDPDIYLIEYNPIDAEPNEIVNFIIEITVTDPETNNSCLAYTTWRETWTEQVIEPKEPEKPKKIPFFIK